MNLKCPSKLSIPLNLRMWYFMLFQFEYYTTYLTLVLPLVLPTWCHFFFITASKIHFKYVIFKKTSHKTVIRSDRKSGIRGQQLPFKIHSFFLSEYTWIWQLMNYSFHIVNVVTIVHVQSKDCPFCLMVFKMATTQRCSAISISKLVAN